MPRACASRRLRPSRPQPRLSIARARRDPRGGLIWLTAILGLSVILAGQLGALAVETLAEQHTVAVLEAQARASCAAEAGLAVTCAQIAAGRASHTLAGRCGPASYRATATRTANGWRIVSTGTAGGPLGLVAKRTIEALCSPSGQVLAWRYVRPLEPSPAGRT